jgi:sugar (pentulose or hexulose) kinase
VIDLLVGVDAGTTRVKAVATDAGLTVLGEHSVPTPWRHSGAMADADPSALAAAAVQAATGAVRAAGGRAVAVGVTGMAETGVLLDRHGTPLAPALAWHDPRGDCDTVAAELGEDVFRRTAGRALTPVTSLPTLLWLRRHLPETRSAVRYLSIPEWTIHALGGDQVNELSLLSRTGLFDIAAKRPWADALAMLDATPDLLGRIVGAGEPVGRVHDEAPPELRGAVLTVAGHDHQTAAYALGAARVGVLLDSLGTAEALLRTIPATLSPADVEELSRAGVTTGWGVVPDHLCLLAALPTGISLERLGAMVGAPTPADRTELGRRATAADRSASAIRVTADFHGLTVHDVDDEAAPELVWAAAVEDISAAAVAILAAIAAVSGPHSEVLVTGGWLHNPMVRAVKERQFEGFASRELAEPGALGAAELAGVAVGLVAPRWEGGAR